MDFLTDKFLVDPERLGGPVLVTGAGGCIGAWVMATAALRRAGIDSTAHGFRSCFRDFCAEAGIDRELAETALAHRVGKATERAYWRSDIMERRRAVMESWAVFLERCDDGRCPGLITRR